MLLCPRLDRSQASGSHLECPVGSLAASLWEMLQPLGRVGGPEGRLERRLGIMVQRTSEAEGPWPQGQLSQALQLQ